MSEKLKGGLFGMRKKEQLSENVIKGFRKFIVETVQRCRCINNYADKHGFDDFLMYDLTDVDWVQIGCVESGNFILDSDFIYTHFESYWKKEGGSVRDLFDKSLFYELLYKAKVTCSCTFYSRKPLHTIRSMGGIKKKKYFCIAKDSVGYSNSMLNWL